MGNHSGLKCTSSQPPPPPTVVQHQPVIIPDGSSRTTEAPPAMFNLVDNYSALDKAYIEPARQITTDHSAKLPKKTLKKPIQNSTDHPELPTFDPLQPLVPFQKSVKPIAHLILRAGCHYSNSNLQCLSCQLHYGTTCSQH